MDPILTPEEIDALLDTMAAEASPGAPGGAAGKAVKRYDFRRPDKFSKDQLRAFHLLHDNLARALSASWSALLRTTVRVRVTSVEQMTYGEFIRSLPSLTILAVFAAPPLEGMAILEINPDIAYPMIDRLLGGSGEPLNAVRELTEIERALFEGMLLRALNNLAESWQGLVALTPTLESIEMNPQFTQIVAENEAALLVILEASMNERMGLMSLCFPAMFLEGVLTKLSAQQWITSFQKGSEEQALLWRQNLRDVELPVVACLGRAEIPVRDLLQLRTGDVIILDQPIDHPLPVAVGEQVRFYGRPGAVRKQLAVNITDLAEDINGAPPE